MQEIERFLGAWAEREARGGRRHDPNASDPSATTKTWDFLEQVEPSAGFPYVR